MAVPFGLSTTFAYSLTDGQSVTVLYGWIFVSLISLGIASSLAEICAVYPTAGGVYYCNIHLSRLKCPNLDTFKGVHFSKTGEKSAYLEI